MNHLFLELRAKEKVRELIDEGVTSQLHERSSMKNSGAAHRITQLIMILLSLWGIAELLMH